VAAPERIAAIKGGVWSLQRRLVRVCCAVKEGQEREVAWVMGLARAVVLLLGVMVETPEARSK
jgi:hypothetical protein